MVCPQLVSSVKWRLRPMKMIDASRWQERVMNLKEQPHTITKRSTIRHRNIWAGRRLVVFRNKNWGSHEGASPYSDWNQLWDLGGGGRVEWVSTVTTEKRSWPLCTAISDTRRQTPIMSCSIVRIKIMLITSTMTRYCLNNHEKSFVKKSFLIFKNFWTIEMHSAAPTEWIRKLYDRMDFW